jgi:hypothetical protein
MITGKSPVIGQATRHNLEILTNRTVLHFIYSSHCCR